MEWTSETIARLQELWQQGLSTAEIGRQLSITKNAVVGKAHRLGLPPRPSPIRAGGKPRKMPEAKTPKAGKTGQDVPAAATEAKPARRKPTSQQDESMSKIAEKPVKAAQKANSETAARKAADPAVAPGEAGPQRPVRTPEAVKTNVSAPVSAPTAKASAVSKASADKEMLRPLLRPLNVDQNVRKGPACCWPFGDPGTPEFRFCGAKPVPGKPYCAEHCAVAYVKLRDRRENSGGGSAG